MRIIHYQINGNRKPRQSGSISPHYIGQSSRLHRQISASLLIAFTLITVGTLVGLTLFVPRYAYAMIWLRYRVCHTGFVSIEGYSYPTTTCWKETITIPTPTDDPQPVDDPLPWDPWHPPYIYPPLLPNTSCIESRVNKYGQFKQFNTDVVYDQKWGFVDTTSSPKEYYYSLYSNDSPPGYTWLLGRYDPQYPSPADGGVVHIYRGAYDRAWNQRAATLTYIDPDTHEAKVLHGPFPPDEMMTIVLEHEFGHAAHQNLPEKELTGYGVKALKAYKDDPNADSCR